MSCQLVIFLGWEKVTENKYRVKVNKGIWKGSHLPSNSYPLSLSFPTQIPAFPQNLSKSSRSQTLTSPECKRQNHQSCLPWFWTPVLVQTGVSCPAKPVCWTSWFWNPFIPGKLCDSLLPFWDHGFYTKIQRPGLITEGEMKRPLESKWFVATHSQILSDDIWMCISNNFSKMNIFFFFFLVGSPLVLSTGGNEEDMWSCYLNGLLETLINWEHKGPDKTDFELISLQCLKALLRNTGHLFG